MYFPSHNSTSCLLARQYLATFVDLVLGCERCWLLWLHLCVREIELWAAGLAARAVHPKRERENKGLWVGKG